MEGTKEIISLQVLQNQSYEDSIDISETFVVGIKNYTKSLDLLIIQKNSSQSIQGLPQNHVLDP
jgi:hypothetical protein